MFKKPRATKDIYSYYREVFEKSIKMGIDPNPRGSDTASFHTVPSVEGTGLWERINSKYEYKYKYTQPINTNINNVKVIEDDEEFEENMIKDNFNRKSLAEGRNFGFGFAFVNKLEDNSYESMQAFTACKDYLNDLVYVEKTNIQLDSIYGFKHTYTGYFKDKDFVYLGIKPLNYNSGNDYDKYDVIEDALVNNHNNLIKLLNGVEKELFKLDSITEFEYLEEGTLILKVPKFWVQFHFLSSLYCLLIRAFATVSNESLDKELKDTFEEVISEEKYIIKSDSMMILKLKELFNEAFLDNFIGDYNYPQTKVGSGSIHNHGFIGRSNEVAKKLKKEVA